MIGTLMGLVNLLKQLSDPDAIAPAMALALITTFYGSILANLIFLPIYYTPASNILKQAKDIGYAPKFFGADGMDGILTMEGF